MIDFLSFCLFAGFCRRELRYQEGWDYVDVIGMSHRSSRTLSGQVRCGIPPGVGWMQILGHVGSRDGCDRCDDTGMRVLATSRSSPMV